MIGKIIIGIGIWILVWGFINICYIFYFNYKISKLEMDLGFKESLSMVWFIVKEVEIKSVLWIIFAFFFFGILGFYGTYLIYQYYEEEMQQIVEAEI